MKFEIGDTVLYPDRKRHQVRKIEIIKQGEPAFPTPYYAKDVESGDVLIVYREGNCFPLDRMEDAIKDAEKSTPVWIY